MKKLWILLFTLSGSLISSWLAPRWITWFYQSPVAQGFDCTPALQWGLKVLLISQFVGACFGVTLGTLVVLWIEARKKSLK